jgi:hypothetical protein
MVHPPASRRVQRKLAAVVAAAVMTLFGVMPALAASNYHNSPKLPGGDYIQTNIWIGNMGPTNWFNAQSSTWVIGNHPYYPYLTEDSMTVNVNGIAITAGWPPSANWTTLSSANFLCDEYYTGYCGNLVYNITFDSGIWWNNTGSDYSKTILYSNTQPFYNHTSVTNWCC